MDIFVFCIGVFLGVGFSQMFYIPLFYGFPRSIYWVKKGRAKWRAAPFWLVRPVFALIIFGFIGVVFLMVISFIVKPNAPRLGNLYLLLADGINIGSVFPLFQFVTKNGRSKMTDYFLKWTAQFITPAGDEFVDRILGKNEVLEKWKKFYEDARKGNLWRSQQKQ